MSTQVDYMPAKHHREKGAVLLRLIGAFKLSKAAFLILLAFASLKMINHDTSETIRAWAHHLHVAPGNERLQKLIAKSLSITKRELELAATVLTIYAAMFATEGVGLILEKRWAEWMTVITTAGLIPFEIYEIFEKPGRWKIIALVLNVLMAVYLAGRVWKETHAKRNAQELPKSS
jgi:uncharacterized membrane protein (DUF2068 family)